MTQTLLRQRLGPNSAGNRKEESFRVNQPPGRVDVAPEKMEFCKTELFKGMLECSVGTAGLVVLAEFDYFKMVRRSGNSCGKWPIRVKLRFVTWILAVKELPPSPHICQVS